MNALSPEQLDKLRTIRAESEPHNAEQLLKLCCVIYIRARSACYENYMEGATALFDEWYTAQHKFDTVHTRNYPAFPYPDVCICGKRFSATGSNLRTHCIVCTGQWKKHYVGAYDIQRLARIAVVDERYLESIFAKILYHLL